MKGEIRVPLWYLASPYSSSNPAVMEQRFKRVCQAAAALMRQGKVVFSPIAHSHPIAYYGLPRDWSYWQCANILMLSRCDGLIVLMLEGWEESKGVAGEIKYAKEHNIPIQYEVVE